MPPIAVISFVKLSLWPAGRHAVTSGCSCRPVSGRQTCGGLASPLQRIGPGQPDQGFEGFSFVGWSLYDGLVN